MRTKRKTHDRRADRRYNVTLDVRWTIIYRKQVLYSGTGRTVNFSSGGILFETDEPPAVGRTIEMAIPWPVSFEASVPLQLIIQASVVRTAGKRVAVGIQHCEFRRAA